MSWAEKSLDELGTVSRGRSRHRPRDAAHLYGGEYPFIQTGDVKHAGLYLTEYEHTYSEAGLAQSKLWPEGTLCITIAANIADTSILKIRACFPDSVIGFIPEKEKADARFIKYLFDAMLKKRYMNFTQGAAQDNLSQGKLLSLKFPVPNFRTQKSIADILCKYDELIDNNNRRIELLEESARQLFKEWFVRFRFPGHEHIKIINGVPAGWESKKVGDLLMKIKRPGKVKKDEYLEFGEFPCVDQSRDFIGGYTDASDIVIKEPLPLVVFGDHTRVLKFIDFPFACGADGTQLLHPNDDRLSIQYFYFALVTVDLSNYFYARHFKFLKDQILLIPTEQLMQAFTDIASTNMKQVSKLRDQNKQLALARDLLLPKLMNGEIAV
ncbi:restriction modification system DNA specificity domain-containing protein [Marinobacter santoriniensis NKSG1]|uniref:Restriction modification system DNA specificity domain-containing protein n=1 Tax=Marinobacter santoriniensis NKSG1 TaxID=1288826 RepID=M7DCG8_9GAMM|nr:restriction endonuclease subunit S [Marinobacter santoriniensis]EMP55362.1 restriction modification system DNA specificity domain-containing protein [Marinobacter santoriniensis NKSG1]